MKVNKLFLRYFSALAGFLILCFALMVLYGEMKNYHIGSVMATIHEYPGRKIIIAALITVLSYCLVTLYDFLAFLYVGNSPGGGKIFLTSLVSYLFGNNIGVAIVSSSAVRFRFYSAWNISSVEIVKIISFTIATLWIGMLTSMGVAFIFSPVKIQFFLKFSAYAQFIFGILMLSVVILYLVFVFFYRKPVVMRNWEFELPTFPVSLGQVIVSSADWVVASLVLYILLPSSVGVSFIAFFSVFMLAQTGSLASNVPGGIGVFETIIMVMMPSSASPPELLGSLLLYRLIFYLLPFMFGLALFVTHEILQYRHVSAKMISFFGKWFPELYPTVLAFLIFLAGILLLFSSALPVIEYRLHWLEYVFPIHIVEISHFISSIIGMLLLVLASRIQKRVDASYFLTIILLISASVLALLKGLNYGEAAILTVILMLFVPCRRFFYRKTPLLNDFFSPEWLAGILAATAATIWIGMFVNKHVEYSSVLWWQFEFSNNTSRFMRAGFGLVLFLLLFSMVLLLRVLHEKPEKNVQTEVAVAQEIVSASDRPEGNLLLLGDKYLFFSDDQQAFIMYGVQGKNWIVLGDPIGSPSVIPELIWNFHEKAVKQNRTPLFFEITNKYLPVFIEIGMMFLKIGENAMVDLFKFSLEGSANKDFRYSLNRMNRDGFTFRIAVQDELPEILPRLKEISDIWLENKNTREKGFSLGSFREEYLKNFRMALVEREGRIVAFANIMTTGTMDVITVDLMRYDNDVPNGIMDFLFTSVIMWGKSSGYHYFSLGVVPLSGLVSKPSAPLWNKIATVIFGHGEKFYNFQGLRTFKNKFHPEWQPRYIAYKNPLSLPLALSDIAILTSGGIKGIITK